MSGDDVEILEKTTPFQGYFRIDSSQLKGVHGLEEEAEDIRVFPLAAEEAFQWIESGRICNGMTIIGLEWLARNRGTLQARWAATTV